MPNWRNPKYDLALKRDRVLKIGLILSLALLTLAFKYFPDIKIEKVEIEPPQDLFDVQTIPKTGPDKPPPPVKPVILVHELSDEPPVDIELGPTGLDTYEPSTNPPPLYNNEEETAPPFKPFADDMPAPVGGIAAIQTRIEYPEIAKRAGVQGKVFVKAYIDELGIVKKVELIRGIGAGCDEEAMEAVRLTRFHPGKQRGKAVRVQVSIPIVFKLQ